MGWRGDFSNRPPCPKCGHALSEEEKAKAQEDVDAVLAEARARLEAKERRRVALGGGWAKPYGASRLHWFERPHGRSACAAYPKPSVELLSPSPRRPTDTRCWECCQRRCPTGDHSMLTCPGDHGK